MKISPVIAALPRDQLIGEFSVWSADLVRLADDIKRIAPHADILHIDMADEHFAPTMLFFPDLVSAARDLSNVPIHVHLMVDDSILIDQIRQFSGAGSDLISIHVESGRMLAKALDVLDDRGVAAGKVLKFDTPVKLALPYLPRSKILTLLGTAISAKGQRLSENAEARLAQTLWCWVRWLLARNTSASE